MLRLAETNTHVIHGNRLHKHEVAHTCPWVKRNCRRRYRNCLLVVEKSCARRTRPI